VYRMTKRDWSLMDEFLLSLSSERTIVGFSAKILERITSLVSFEGSGCLIETRDGVPTIQGSIQSDSKWTRDFNEYYGRIATPPDTAKSTFSASLRDLKKINYREYISDFLDPQRIGSSAGLVLFDAPCEKSFVVVCNRLRSEKRFSERELAVLGIAERHVRNTYGMLRMIDDLSRLPILSVELGKFARLLSERECEVLKLLIGRLRPAEIAAELRISPLTVKKHIGNIYVKLDVTSRRQLLKKLLDDRESP
jgi:DNA-binding CsgD family transcriptional regulator